MPSNGGTDVRAPALILAVLALAGAGTAEQKTGRVPAVAAGAHVGEVATVCGAVTTFGCEPPAFATVLDLDTPRWVPTFRIVIGRSDRARFGTNLEDRYRRGRLCVHGLIERDGPGTRILVRDPDQLELENADITAASTPERLYRSCDEGVSPPVVLRQVTPQYTPDAMRAGIEGRVLLQGIVDPTGHLRDVSVVYSLDSRLGLDGEALKAFRQWRFTPGRLHGRPVPVAVTADFAFTLPPSRSR